jgi:gamma-glutamylcyclotransferase
MPIYFAYGSNMRSARLLRRIGTARALGPVHISDWRLTYNKPGLDGSGKANLVAEAGAKSWGVAYEIATRSWEQLDSFELDYQRAHFRLEQSDGSNLEAQAYLFLREEARVLVPSRDYLDHLLVGAREHGLPSDYITTISRLASRGE